MRVAITREISTQMARCELTFQERRLIDLELARAQHRSYEECLSSLGCSVHHLPEEPELPDSVFVEDTAIALEELAVITRPGAESRRPEIDAIAHALRPHRSLNYIEQPGTLDGGDVLCVGKRIFVGLSRRSNEAGLLQLRHLLAAHGYTVTGVRVQHCLHLKSAITQVADDTLLINRDWADGDVFAPARLIDVDRTEPGAANALRIGDGVVFPSAYPETRRRLEIQGIRVHSVDLSELAKAEGGVTCCSLIFSV
jgi:dimethylargininase